jgi:hypothetical protein
MSTGYPCFSSGQWGTEFGNGSIESTEVQSEAICAN